MGICYSSPVLSLRICDQPRRNRGCQRSKRRVGGDARGRRTATAICQASAISAYAPAWPCLRACYAMSTICYAVPGTDVRYMPTPLLRGARLYEHGALVSFLRPCYAMSGSAIAYPNAMHCSDIVYAWRIVPRSTLCDVR
eukprot:3336169-Rhodomonas_salina.1